MSNITAIRGMNDILPDETPYWQYLEQSIARVLASYGYGEIRLPVVEKTELFKRNLGEATDDEAIETLLDQPAAVFAHLLEDHEQFTEKETDDLKKAFAVLVDMNTQSDQESAS